MTLMMAKLLGEGTSADIFTTVIRKRGPVEFFFSGPIGTDQTPLSAPLVGPLVDYRAAPNGSC